MIHIIHEKLTQLGIIGPVDESKARSLKLLYYTLVQETSRLWMLWDQHLEDALRWTAQYYEGAQDTDPQVLHCWKIMKSRAMNDWAESVDIAFLIWDEFNGLKIID